MNICIAETDDQIAACYPIMRELRPHVAENEFICRIRSQQENGYRLVYMERDGSPVAVAGFRTGENLSWGRFLYIDDLVTAAAHRSQGYGSGLLSWLRQYAGIRGCAQMHLDSGLQRVEAHRFYEREGMSRTGFHFAQELTAHNAPHPGRGGAAGDVQREAPRSRG